VDFDRIKIQKIGFKEKRSKLKKVGKVNAGNASFALLDVMLS